MTQLSHVGRFGYPGASGTVAVSETLFLIGDQQTPEGPSEFYRIRANGAQEMVFSDGVSVVSDVASFGGRAWFITVKGDAQIRHSTLWSIGETGVKQKVVLGIGQEPSYLDTDGGGLTVVYHPAAGTMESIARVAEDGTITFPYTAGFASARIFDVCTLNGEIYFTGTSPTGGGLYHVTEEGAAEPVDGIGNGAPDSDVNGMHVSGGKLWFTGAWQVSDGFGGFTTISVSYSIDSSGAVTVESGLTGHQPDLVVIQGYDFTMDFPDPVLGSGGADVLRGSAAGELISAMAGRDLAQGLGGNDTATGGSGNDTPFGDRGNDLVPGGSGNDHVHGDLGLDTMTGGLGADWFVFDDRITDFTIGLDRIVLNFPEAMVPFPSGRIAPRAFWAADGAVAGHDDDGRVVFNTSTGTVYFDADGAGAGKSVRIAELGPHADLVASDIYLYLFDTL